jgi:hypothetical protein
MGLTNVTLSGKLEAAAAALEVPAANDACA